MTAQRRALAVLFLLYSSTLHAAAPPRFSGVDRHGDPLPRSAIARLGTARPWDDRRGKGFARPAGHRGRVTSLAFSHDGARVASGGEDGTVLVWDLATERPMFTFEGHYRCVPALAFSPDGRWLATGDGQLPTATDSRLAQVRIFDLDTGRVVHRFQGHLHGVNALLFSPDSKRLATAGPDERIRVWDSTTGTRMGQVRHLPSSRPIAFLDRGKSLLVYQQGTGFHHFDSSFALLGNFGRHEASAGSVAAIWLPGAGLAVTASSGRVEWYDLVDRTRSRSLELRIDPQLCALSPDAKILAEVSSRKAGISLWDLDDGKEVDILAGHASDLTVLAFSPDGQWLVSGSADRTVLLWDVGRLHLKHVLSELLAGRGQVRHLARFGERGVAILTDPLRQSAHGEKIARHLIESLGDDDFRVREKATQTLRTLGGEVAFALKQALEATRDVEVRFRINRLLAQLDRKALEFNLARVRITLEILGKLNTPPARRALEELARLDRSTVIGRAVHRALKQIPREARR
jgi:WD40 repeat protein